MNIDVSTLCKQGGREYNQDYVSTFFDTDGGCFVLCDGLGGYSGSENASKIAARSIIKQFKDKPVLQEKALEKYITHAHKQIIEFKKYNPQNGSICTTVTSVLTDFESVIVGHVGDSRIYYFSGDQILYQSVDHSLSQLAVEIGDITVDQIREHPDRNILLKVVGSKKAVEPTVIKLDHKVKPGDRILLMTDGFWEYVHENEMIEDMKKSENPKEWIDKMERRLLKRVEYGNDNYSAVAVFLD